MVSQSVNASLSMSASHTRSVFANSCLSTPRKVLSTSLPNHDHKEGKYSQYL